MSLSPTLKNIDLLKFTSETSVWWGACQQWYPTSWQRNAGCGPTTCSMLLWYLAATRKSCRPLLPTADGGKNGFLQLMEAVWNYVTPGPQGLNRVSMFQNGAERYTGMRGVSLSVQTLEVPPILAARPSLDTVLSFLTAALQNDCPVAFLNLSNGLVKNLDSWHWVTLAGVDTANGHALMLDNGRKDTIDLGLWLRSTLLGGGFAFMRPEEPST